MMTSAASTPVKFRFDLDLGHRAEHNSVLSDTAIAALISAARDEGRREGIAEGERAASVRATEALARAAESLADHTAAHNASLDDSRQATLRDAVGLSTSIARKLARTLIERQPAAEIEALVTECLASLDTVPHLVIRCHVDLADAIRDIATARIATSGFSGRLVVLGEPDIQLGDARIEWADGGIVRDSAALDAQINERIAEFLAARGGNTHSQG